MIPFKQYHRAENDVRVADGGFERAAEVEALAARLTAHGVQFSCEELATGEVCLTAEDANGDLLAIEVVANGPKVLDAVDKVVAMAATRVT